LNEIFDEYKDPEQTNYSKKLPKSDRTRSFVDVTGNNTNVTGTESGPYIVWTDNYNSVSTLTSSGGTILSDPCPACGSDGVIQGSMDGVFNEEPLKRANDWLQAAKTIIGELADIESGLGMGGSEVINVAKHKTETIGMVMNDFGSVRVDTQGKYYKSGVHVLPHSVVNNREVSPVVEYVHVDDLPGGSYTLNVCNRWNVQIGAGGMSMKSYGPVDIGGTITNIGGTQVNIGSENEINIDGGKRVNIVGDILTLRQRTGKQVLVDSNLGVAKNVVIGGGLHVEGELCVNHVTAPVEIQETQETELWGTSEFDWERVIGFVQGDDIVVLREDTAVPPEDVILYGKIPHPDPDNFPGPPNAPDGFKYYTISTAKPVYSRFFQYDSDIGTSDQFDKEYIADDDCIRIYPHSHHFKNLPLHLKKENKLVRDVAVNFHDGDRAPPGHREWVQADQKDA